MNKRDVASIACRILGVYFFTKSIQEVPIFIFTLVSTFAVAPQTLSGWLTFWGIAVSFLNATLTLGISLLLWFKARQFAERIFPEDSSPTTLAVDERFMPMALSLTGVVVLALTLPYLFSTTITYLTLPETLSHVPMDRIIRNRIDIGTSIFQILIGIWLVLGAGNISRIIKAAIHATRDRKA